MFPRNVRIYVSMLLLLAAGTCSPVAAIDSVRAESLDNLPYKYVGNSFSLKFHRPSCPFAKAMSVRHVQLFHFRREAIAAGEKPCRYCLPPWWKSVKVFLKPAEPSCPEGKR
jgi:hypothetical protein